MSENGVRRFSDQYVAGVDFCRKTTSKDILNQELIVENVFSREGDKGTYIVIEARLNDERIVFTTGSSVVVPKLLVARDNFPLSLTFFQDGRSLDIR